MCFPDSPESQRFYLNELIEAVEGVPRTITRTFGVEHLDDAELGARVDYFMLLNSVDRYLRTRAYVRDNVGDGEESGQAFIQSFIKVAITAVRTDTLEYLAPVLKTLGATPDLTVQRVAYDQTERLKFLREIFHAIVEVCDDIKDRLGFAYEKLFAVVNADLKELDASILPAGVAPPFPCSEDIVTALLVMASKKAAHDGDEDTAASRQKFYKNVSEVLVLIYRACLSPVEYASIMQDDHDTFYGEDKEKALGFFVDGNGDALFTTASLAGVRGLALRDLLRRRIAEMHGVDLVE